MSRLVIFEGARGTGKSTIARAIREKISEVTLVNPTGFHADGEEGFNKIAEYYDAWINMIHSLSSHDSTFVFDRFFFTERVFSELYKNYDFNTDYNIYLRCMCESAEVDVIFLTIDDNEELGNRLTRDKVPFGKVEESVTETLKQQDLYKDIMFDFSHDYSSDSVRLHTIDTSKKTLEEIQNEVFKIIKREET